MRAHAQVTKLPKSGLGFLSAVKKKWKRQFKYKGIRHPAVSSSQEQMLTQLPSGRIETKKRGFADVCADLRHAVYAVIRLVPMPDGKYRVMPTGSGFFISPTAFVTCHHVVNPMSAPYADGEGYQLVKNLVSGAELGGVTIVVPKTARDANLHLFPELDLAIIEAEPQLTQSYVTLDYGDVRPGDEIGVAGYPLPGVEVATPDQITYQGLRFRVARGTVNAGYHTVLHGDQIRIDSPVPVIEVNFLFVPGNSGGPIFRADTGRVVGFVHGFNAIKVAERIESSALEPLPIGVGSQYLLGLTAIYSLGIRLSAARSILERFSGLGAARPSTDAETTTPSE